LQSGHQRFYSIIFAKTSSNETAKWTPALALLAESDSRMDQQDLWVATEWAGPCDLQACQKAAHVEIRTWP
jgi:hypothetical protein